MPPRVQPLAAPDRLRPPAAPPCRRLPRHPFGFGLAWLTFTLALTCLTPAALPLSAANPPTEYQVKAGYLFNFAKLVEWPSNRFESTTAPLVIGVAADPDTFDTLRAVLEGKTAQGRPLMLRPWRELPPNPNPPIHLLFLTRSGATPPPDQLRACQQSPLLTVGEQEGFIQQGGIINFFLTNATIRIEINPDAAERAGLKVNAKIAAVARVVRADPLAPAPK